MRAIQGVLQSRSQLKRGARFGVGSRASPVQVDKFSIFSELPNCGRSRKFHKGRRRVSEAAHIYAIKVRDYAHRGDAGISARSTERPRGDVRVRPVYGCASVPAPPSNEGGKNPFDPPGLALGSIDPSPTMLE